MTMAMNSSPYDPGRHYNAAQFSSTAPSAANKFPAPTNKNELFAHLSFFTRRLCGTTYTFRCHCLPMIPTDRPTGSKNTSNTDKLLNELVPTRQKMTLCLIKLWHGDRSRRRRHPLVLAASRRVCCAVMCHCLEEKSFILFISLDVVEGFLIHPAERRSRRRRRPTMLRMLLSFVTKVY